jgi:molecular chaperone GrpE
VTDSNDEPQRLSDAAEGSQQDTSASELAAARTEADKFKTEFLYQRAEFENYKKQVIKERSDLRKYGAERLAVDLLNVLDIFETALATELTPENAQTFRRGIEMTASELRSVLNRNGIEEIPAKGIPFDPSVHEALSSEEVADVEPGTITRVFKKPYKLHDRIIRPGQVIVAKKS